MKKKLDCEVAIHQAHTAALERELKKEQVIAKRLAYWHTVFSVIICPSALLDCDHTINGKDCPMDRRQAVECWLRAARQEVLSREE